MIDAVQVFKILNFSVVIGLFVYLIRRYGILQIMTMMRTERQGRQNLKSELKVLQSDYGKIDKDMKLQERSYRIMKDKFQIWQRQVVQQDEQEIQDFENRKELIQKHRSIKSQSLQRRNIIKKELPGLIQEVSEELKNNFATGQGQEKYTKQLVALLEKSDA